MSEAFKNILSANLRNLAGIVWVSHYSTVLLWSQVRVWYSFCCFSRNRCLVRNEDGFRVSFNGRPQQTPSLARNEMNKLIFIAVGKYYGPLSSICIK